MNTLKNEYILWFTEPSNKNTYVRFLNQESKDVYLRNEAHFCENELTRLYRAITKKEREDSKKVLNKKRVSFIKSLGYKLVGNEYVHSNEPKEAA